MIDVWSPPPAIDIRMPKSARYIAVTGCSGAGKSTAVNRLAQDIFGGHNVVAIDERDTHHPYLDRLFHDPARYGFELQLNFMIQRLLIVRRWLDAGVNVVMERSHLEDPVFIEHLFNIGVVDQHGKDAYLAISAVLEKRHAPPDVLVAMSVSPSTAFGRITKAEEEGERPREFDSDDQKLAWLTSWAQLYAQRFVELSELESIQGRLILTAEHDDYSTLVTKIRQILSRNGSNA